MWLIIQDYAFWRLILEVSKKFGDAPSGSDNSSITTEIDNCISSYVDTHSEWGID